MNDTYGEDYPVYAGSRSPIGGWGARASGLRCGCSGDDSCYRCDGAGRDDWAIEKGARDMDRYRAHMMSVNRAFRREWLATFADPQVRAEMAAYADRTFGPMAFPDDDAVGDVA